MGFGGATAAMIASLKNNSRRSQREGYEGWSTDDIKSGAIKAEPISEGQLQAIRNKLKKQQQVLFRKRLIAYAIGFGSILALILYISTTR